MSWRVITYDCDGHKTSWPDQQFATEVEAREESDRRVARQSPSQATLVLSPEVDPESVRMTGEAREA